MTSTKKFIEDAIKGGWLPELWRLNPNLMQDEEHIRENVFDEFEPTPPEVVLLDPLAWQAVGKTRSWGMMEHMDLPLWRDKLHSFIDALADGKDIEEALQAIE